MGDLNKPRLARLKLYWQSKGFKSATAFADFLEIGKSHISDIDNKDCPAVLLQALALKTQLNLHWLLTGAGSMEHDVSCLVVSDGIPLQELVRDFNKLPEHQQWKLVGEIKRLLAEIDK